MSQFHSIHRNFPVSLKAVVFSLVTLFSYSVFAVEGTTQQESLKDQSSKQQTPDRTITGFESSDELQPLWEFGAGGGYAETPNYPASSERNNVALAAPYFIYRGDVFRVGDGGGVRAVVAEKSDWEVDFSFGGSLSADSDEDGVRQGMPELDFLFEVGPQLIYTALNEKFEDGSQQRLNIRLQARAVFSTDFGSINQQGYVFEPEIQWQQRGMLFEKTALSITFSMTFASEALQDYFYQVDPVFVTEQRPEFNASGGYLGSNLGVGISFPVTENIRGFVGGSLRSHHGAANEDSPLFEKKLNWQAGVGFVWRIYESKTKATY